MVGTEQERVERLPLLSEWEGLQDGAPFWVVGGTCGDLRWDGHVAEATATGPTATRGTRR